MPKLDPEQLKDHFVRFHGFSDHVEALKAAAVLAASLWAVITFGLDTRYAAKAVEEMALTTWEVTITNAIEDTQKKLCDPGVQGDYRSQLNRRMAERVAEYIEIKGTEPYIPRCRGGNRFPEDRSEQ